MQPVVSFGRVFFGLWNRFFLCALPGSPRPPCTMQKYPLPYRRGGCSPDAKQPKEQQEETALCTVFPLALRDYG